jgi:hypothetical protein
MAHRDRLDCAKTDSEVGAVAEEDRPFRPRIEQQRAPDVLGVRNQPQPKPQVGAQQRLAGNDPRPGQHDVGKLGHRKQGLADIGVADIVGDHLND